MTSPAVPEDRSGFGRSVGGSFFGQGVAGLLRSATAVVAARLVGAEEFGTYSLAVVVVLVGFQLSNLGLSSAATYRVAHSEDRARTSWAAIVAAVALGIVAALGAGAVLAAVSAVGGLRDPLAYAVALVSLPAYLVTTTATGLALGHQDYRSYNVVALCTQAAVFIATVVAALIAPSAVALALAWTLGQLVASAVAVARVRHLWRGVASTPDRVELRALGGFGLRNHASTVVTFLSYRIDLILVGLLLGAEAAGWYAAAVALGETVWFFSQVASTVLFARVAAERDVARRRAIAAVATRLVTTASLLAAVVLGVLAGPVVDLLYGSGFAPAVSALRVVLIGIVALSASRMLANYIAAVGRPAANIPGSVAALIVNVVLNLIWIPAYGIIGAAAATAVSYTLTLVARLVVYGRLAVRDDAASDSSGLGESDRARRGEPWLGVLLPRRADLAMVRDALSRGRSSDRRRFLSGRSRSRR